MDFSDPRFHTRTISWEPLIRDGYCVRRVLVEAQKQRLFKISASASTRLENEKRKRDSQNGISKT